MPIQDDSRATLKVCVVWCSDAPEYRHVVSGADGPDDAVAYVPMGLRRRGGALFAVALPEGRAVPHRCPNTRCQMKL